MGFPQPDRFVVGANLPWIGYGTDVGSSAWYPQGGLSAQPAALDLLEETFAMLSGECRPRRKWADYAERWRGNIPSGC